MSPRTMAAAMFKSKKSVTYPTIAMNAAATIRMSPRMMRAPVFMYVLKRCSV